MYRRRFIIALITSLLAARGGDDQVRSGNVSDPSIEAMVGDLFSDVADAQTIGQRYLHLYPHHARRSVLLAQLKITEAIMMGHRSGFKKVLSQRRNEQFLSGDTVIIDGWILACCEAQLCALLALS